MVRKVCWKSPASIHPKDKLRSLGLCTLQYYVALCVTPVFVVVCSLMDIERKGALLLEGDCTAIGIARSPKEVQENGTAKDTHRERERDSYLKRILPCVWCICVLFLRPLVLVLPHILIPTNDHNNVILRGSFFFIIVIVRSSATCTTLGGRRPAEDDVSS
mmetsp:Transcript_7502/g.18482  ORF Transcript_7502/g.18482 Transcript_7502/m.18482 type:complete len:161 (-) Transcript_7502:603-1085(-)